jgi:hypothetical protein
MYILDSTADIYFGEAQLHSSRRDQQCASTFNETEQDTASLFLRPDGILARHRSTLSTNGCLGRSVADLALSLSSIAGPDPNTPLAINEPGNLFGRPLDRHSPAGDHFLAYLQVDRGLPLDASSIRCSSMRCKQPFKKSISTTC